MSTLRKQTKSENISVILDFELQTDVRLDQRNRTYEQLCNFKREGLLLYGDSNRQIKDLLSENVSFIRSYFYIQTSNF